MTVNVVPRPEEKLIEIIYLDFVPSNEQEEGIDRCLNFLQGEYMNQQFDVMYLDQSHHFERNNKLIGKLTSLASHIGKYGGNLLVVSKTQNSPLAKFVLAIVGGISGAIARTFNTEEEAREFLKLAKTKKLA